jgi:hypothetical protein
MNTNNGPKLPELSALERFASRSREEKEEFFLLFSKLLAADLKEQRRTSDDRPEPARKPGHKKSTDRPKVRTVRGVRFVTNPSPGGITIVSNAPLRPPQQKAALIRGVRLEQQQPATTKLSFANGRTGEAVRT